MPDIKFEHVVSCSSEDPNHPAANLLKPETYRKWRSAKPGEDHVCVILQLQKETQIHGIDIGNNCSAFVEVLVGKSSSPPDTQYEVLLVMSSFMTPGESKTGTQGSKVRMFTQSQLCQDVAKKKWDRVKIVCTQPYASHMQYGLSFISLHSPPEEETPLPSTSSPTLKLGKFKLKGEDEDEIRPGSLFARMKDKKDEPSTSLFSKRKDISPQKPKTAAAAIAEASSPSSLAAMETSRTTAAKIKPKKREHSEDKPEANKKRNGHHGLSLSPAKQGSSSTQKGSKFQGDNRKALERDTPPSESPPPVEKVKVTRPFKQLMNDVVIVLSGFQNPLRGTLRQQATEMGAKYQADWDRNCTHLICAFANTPKARQVKATGNGKIVKKEWIEHSHRQRKRFPWRRYAIEAADEDPEESEEEIWEEGTVPASASKTKPSSKIQEPYDGESDDDVQELSSSYSKPAVQSTSQEKPISQDPYYGETDDDDIVEVSKVVKPAEVISIEDDAYNADTDVDSDGDLATLPALPDFMSNLSFSLHEELSDDIKKQMKRYITAFKGKIADDLDESVNFLITETTDGLNELSAFYPDVKPVTPQYVWSCNDAGKLLPSDSFCLKAS